ncbi:hypothetical protein LEP1GSC050_2994 [Leptospira broomii serovar Hurstbridge str. 5399]|uniref:Uncharacterized protein n=1 Tax=Leptospira broomii serovar Hurstbridge str. 5399 TaxID=1049789 RepID=T0GB15_9LEPT|nr:hypothetical protein LEP1GSC050_2994 [Leptospira broomii serovar Hurstbridge str. 5399]
MNIVKLLKEMSQSGHQIRFCIFCFDLRVHKISVKTENNRISILIS